ncbi:hypothetical protein TRFO_28868 [Tritrichomonas foetus]|uniref:Tubby C-terminal domain-containing protein n=1 Tax=Tritrichomonas foetus TaxID=1144522 RepID=A0A1J4K1Q8_9EUKA|nr:hypothetical protein TRFO_28868 [Tritrichomonas foetus]|eukprot:OHT03676.1 hypothetical protein TRFO_28868 [Tritrichomonas foetus]
MSLYTITFSDSSDSSSDDVPYVSKVNSRPPNSRQFLNRRPYPKKSSTIVKTVQIQAPLVEFKAESNQSKKSKRPEKANSANLNGQNLNHSISNHASNLSDQEFMRKTRNDDDVESPSKIHPTNNNNHPIIQSNASQNEKQTQKDTNSVVIDRQDSNLNAENVTTNNNLFNDSNNSPKKISTEQSNSNESRMINASKNIINIKSASEDERIFDFFRVDRSQNSLGKKQKFTLFNGDSKILMTAVAKGQNVEIFNPEKNEIIGTLLITEKKSLFSVRRGNIYGEELLVIQYKSHEDTMPRSLKLNFFVPMNGVPETLRNRKPKRGNFGTWNLNYGKRKVMSSIKNAILVDHFDKEFLVMGKIAANSLSVEAIPSFDPLCVFAVALSSFLNPHA